MQVVLDNMLRVAPAAQYGGDVMTDLERGAINALKTVFPAKNVTTCHFHLNKALYGKVVDLGLKVSYLELNGITYVKYVKQSYSTCH